MKNTALVIPSNRANNIYTFLKAWELSQWDHVIVIEDNPEKTFKIDIKHHYSHKEIDKELGNNSWIISRQDSAIRSYGFLKAYQIGASVIFTLDDDTAPYDNNFVQSHVHNMDSTNRWNSTVDELVVRGMPYHNKGKLSNVNISMSTWCGFPDLDAPHQLINNIDNFISPPINRILSNSQYFPMCGMALAFKRCATPLMYFQGWTKRFDDIFAGIIAKKISDYLSWHVSCGTPRVQHNKASNPFDNLAKEASGIRANETFWETIDKIKLTGKTPSECMLEIADGLEKTMDEFMSQYGRAIKVWIKLLT